MKAILTYHSIDDSGSPISVDLATFRRQIEWLARSGPRVVGVDELLRLGADDTAVAITFDDGFVNFMTDAWPVLRHHALPATLYVPVDHVHGTNEWSAGDAGIPTLPLLAWAQLEQLAAEGVRIGSHTCTHPHLTRVDMPRLQDELERSAGTLKERLGVRAAGLAYPFGDVDDRVARTAAAFYGHACTTQLRALHDDDDPHHLPRLDAYYLRTGAWLEAWGSTRLRVYLRARAGARECRGMVASALRRSP
jgi:peptidoglycan/xylan/chitin deacetylase (PgdA/CDA1 family)